MSRSCCSCHDGGQRSAGLNTASSEGQAPVRIEKEAAAKLAVLVLVETRPRQKLPSGADSGVRVVRMLHLSPPKSKIKSDCFPLFLTSHFMCLRRICEMRNAKLAT